MAGKEEENHLSAFRTNIFKMVETRASTGKRSGRAKIGKRVTLIGNLDIELTINGTHKFIH